MSLKRIPTGINGLDPIVDGGFPKGSLILLAGNPGTGKTIFSAQFLYHGVTEHGENGVYVSFAESRETFFSNMLDFGFEFEKLEEKGKFRLLDMVTMREEGVSSLLEMILSEVRSIKAGRLVIDSFSAMAQAF
ncbi:TPA: circadian clock KaiC-like protein, partial [Candidatus Bathyarchaeota archaeon]|nr:circadian clock KaiC-like protein [Candidatus Bathyarchaeota archaeon]